jgi:tight adherence protein B
VRRERFVRGATAALLVSGALALLGTGPAWADQNVKIRGVETEAFPQMAVTVSAPTGTTGGSFRVTENGRPVRVLQARPLLEAGGTVDVILALDTSDSVRGEPLALAVAAAKRFVQSLPADVAVGVVTFSDQANVLTGITIDHTSILTRLDTLTQTHRGTALYDAVELASKTFSGDAQHNLLLITDGTDTGSVADLPTAIQAANDASVAVFTVGLEGTRTDFQALQTLAKNTGGTFHPVAQADVSKLYEDLARNLTQQFVILYRSTAPSGVQVTVGVATSDGSDRSVVLLPKRAAPGALPGIPFALRGPLGLAVVLVLCFLTALLLGTMVFGARFRARRDQVLAKRMAAPERPDAPRGRAEDGPASWLPQTFVQAGEVVAEAAGFKASMERTLERAGLAITAGEVVASSFGLGLLGLIVGGLLLRSVILALILAAGLSAAPFLWIRRKMVKRLAALHAQLPDVLLILAGSMRAGHSFLQALDIVAKEIGEPGGPEFARVVAEIRLGRPFHEAMTMMGERVGTEEFKWAMLGINVQREVGGNLAEILDTLAETVREREGVYRQVKVLSAEGRMSVKILLVMPLVMTGYLTLINPSYMRLLWTTRLGVIFMSTGIVLMIVGAFWARKVVKIDV